MNFVGPSSFLYVTGDLDLIRIGNDIMPLRSASDGTLRGMDIAFLVEAAEERLRLTGVPGHTQQYSFSRKILAQQPTDANTRIMQAFGSVMGEWLDDGEIPDLLQIQSIPARLSNCVAGLSAVDIDSVETSESGESITKAPIVQLFSNIAALHRFETEVSSVDYSSTTATPTIDQLPAFPDYRADFMQLVSIASQTGGSEVFYSFGKRYVYRSNGSDDLIMYGIANISRDFSSVNFSANLPDPSFAKSRDVYAIVSVLRYKQSWSQTDLYLAKISNNGSVTNASIQSMCASIRALYGNGLVVQTSDMSELDFQPSNSISIVKIFGVDELRDRTRWD